MPYAPIVMRLVTLAVKDPLKLKALIARSPKWSKVFRVDYAGRKAKRVKTAMQDADRAGKKAFEEGMKQTVGKGGKPMRPQNVKTRATAAGKKAYDKAYDKGVQEPRLFWDDLAEGWAGKKSKKTMNRAARFGKTGLIGLGATSLLGMMGGGGDDKGMQPSQSQMPPEVEYEIYNMLQEAGMGGGVAPEAPMQQAPPPAQRVKKPWEDLF